MLRFFFALLVIAGTMSYAHAQRAANPRFCTERGGNIEDCRLKALQTAMAPHTVELGPVCASGCTMQLSAPNVCVRPDIRFRVHAAMYEARFEISAPGNAVLLDHYRRYPKFVARVLRDGALNTRDFTDYTAADLAAAGVPICR